MISSVEPIASVLVKQDYAVRLSSEDGIETWEPTAHFVASSAYIAKNRTAIVGFLKAVLRADRDIVPPGRAGRRSPRA